MNNTVLPRSKTILVSGANGFVGKQLCAELFRQGQSARAVVRSEASQDENIETISIGEINGETDWAEALHDIKTVIHGCVILD